MILSIDPGSEYSAYTVIGENHQPLDFGIMENNEFMAYLPHLIRAYVVETMAIEMIASYGMAVGKEVFETCVWIGMFKQFAFSNEIHVYFVYRKDVKINLCKTYFLQPKI